ncbi:hypothetical protein ATCR1_24435 [Agrobacterium tumefaciens CCNWGS0286]|nr:hypothetical protein ATCR1_24435 [Agrobacterium tumefaciens CCNWGS0286]
MTGLLFSSLQLDSPRRDTLRTDLASGMVSCRDRPKNIAADMDR